MYDRTQTLRQSPTIGTQTVPILPVVRICDERRRDNSRMLHHVVAHTLHT